MWEIRQIGQINLQGHLEYNGTTFNSVKLLCELTYSMVKVPYEKCKAVVHQNS